MNWWATDVKKDTKNPIKTIRKGGKSIVGKAKKMGGQKGCKSVGKY